MFDKFKKAMQENFKGLLAQGQLYITNTDKEKMWDTYLNNFPEDIRQEYNCNCCKSFIRHYGMMVAIIEGQTKTIWNFGCEAPFDKVAKALDQLVSESTITDLFFSTFPDLGTNSNIQLLEDKTTCTWQHMFFRLPKEMVTRSSDSIESLMGKARDNRNVFQRSLNELTVDSVETVLELIAQGSLYRGTEFKGILEEFLMLKRKYDQIPADNRDNYCWVNAPKYVGSVAKIRNTAVGTLLIDISAGKDLDQAVSAFERIMAPTNYKRPNAIITQKMVEQAEATIAELGYKESLGRRFATVDDINIQNMLFVNRDVKKAKGILGELKESVPVNPKSFSKTEEISAEDFIGNILPNCTSIEVLFENRHVNNLVSLITAQDTDAPSMFKWNNPFSWSYKNAVTDSIKEKVKLAGGRTEGDLRVSLEWHNYDDLDLHVLEPGGTHIYFSNKKSPVTGGTLDVDMNAGGGSTREPVENIIWASETTIREGTYVVSVNQFARRESVDHGFSVEIECRGQLYTFSSDKMMRDKEYIEVARFAYSKTDGITKISSTLDQDTKITTRNVWGIDTNKFHKASMILQSPNYWNGKKTGNSHLMFVLNQAHNDEQARGFFNEFLKEDLDKHKRVFEALGSRMKVAPADKQVTGLGFSVTNRNELICKVEGKFNRTLKVKF